ncbi:hypothetical protein AAFF_G00417100 [Aldrovandia affinis]|uniref:Uncharacterized protein n=1 Tax=Aldrovandia affinis TaxID=143900 RepID=A0AAD7WJF6_9TELE|nr:hypothetical protein AAFF_G00417100 [Aldrovandia affinis]
MESRGNFECLIAQFIASNQAQQVRHEQQMEGQRVRHDQLMAEQQQHTAVMHAELQQLITSGSQPGTAGWPQQIFTEADDVEMAGGSALPEGESSEAPGVVEEWSGVVLRTGGGGRGPGCTRKYPTTLLHLQTTKGQYTGPTGIVPDLPVPIIIGRDVLVFCPLWISLAGGVATSS